MSLKIWVSMNSMTAHCYCIIKYKNQWGSNMQMYAMQHRFLQKRPGCAFVLDKHMDFLIRECQHAAFRFSFMCPDVKCTANVCRSEDVSRK